MTRYLLSGLRSADPLPDTFTATLVAKLPDLPNDPTPVVPDVLYTVEDVDSARADGYALGYQEGYKAGRSDAGE